MKSTPAMRARIRELMNNEQDDYDRAVECVLDDFEALEAALREIETICVESAGDCRKRMGTRVGNTIVVARAALEGK